MREAVDRTGLSRSSIYGRIKAGEFPAPVSLGEGRAVGFIEREVSEWIETLASQRYPAATGNA
ncbi:MAG: helix-turn-helix transcriptional regulator [Thermoanaerobaculia bacterium]